MRTCGMLVRVSLPLLQSCFFGGHTPVYHAVFNNRAPFDVLIVVPPYSHHAQRLFEGIPLDKMSVSMTMNGAVSASSCVATTCE